MAGCHALATGDVRTSAVGFLATEWCHSRTAGTDPLRTLEGDGTIAHMAGIDAEVLAQLALADVGKVTFYKRDEITTDLICCDVVLSGKVWTFHEELVGWDRLIEHLQKLPTFDPDWFASVSQPPFASGGTVAFARQ